MILRRILAGLAAGLAALVALAAITLGILFWRFNPNDYKPRIEASVYDATGLRLRFNGPIGLAWALRPTLTVRDIVVENPPGFSSPDLARVEQVALRLDLPALIGRRVVVQSLTLQHPRIALERAASGVANWELAKRPAPGAAPPNPPAAAPRSSSRPVPFAIQLVRVENLDLAYRDDRTGATLTAVVPVLELTAPSPDAPTTFLMRGAANGTQFELNAQTAPLEQIVRGSPLPITAKAHATSPVANIALELSAPRADQPIRLALSGQYRAQPVALTAILGQPGAALALAGPIPLNVQATAAGSTAAISGTIGDPARLAGVTLALTAASPDLAPLAALLGTKLPDLRGLKLSARLQDANGLRQGFMVQDLHLVADKTDLAGTVKVALAPAKSLTADLHGAHLDLAAFRATGPAAEPPKAQTPSPSPGPQKAATGHLIPDTNLPFAALRQDRADVTLRLDKLQAGTETFRDVHAELHLDNGILSTKTHASFAGAPADLVGTVDARPAAPSIAIVASAPALPAGPVLAAFGLPGFVSGKLTLAANLHGTGQTPHLIAATLGGDATLSMQGGTIATQILERALGPAIARANPLAILGHGGSTTLRCLVVRANAANGQVALNPLLLSSDLLTVGGSGKVDLAAETIDLHLRPEGRAGSIGFSVPLTVGGPLRTPRVELVKGEPAAAVIGLLEGMTSKGSGASCASALAQAEGKALPSPPALAPVAAGKKPRAPNPADLLRQFLR